mmetsp:Transcript_61148/g.138341  ORF Transcript_61148/g.138341 Transcript_61148/m.138341 type:complete len:311 (+) Transcript_61148:395-1327(+)
MAPSSHGPANPPRFPTLLTNAMLGPRTLAWTSWCALQKTGMPHCTATSADMSASTSAAPLLLFRVCRSPPTASGPVSAPSVLESMSRPTPTRTHAAPPKSDFATQRRAAKPPASAIPAATGASTILATAGTVNTSPSCQAVREGKTSLICIGRKNRAMFVAAVTPTYCNAKCHVDFSFMVNSSRFQNAGCFFSPLAPPARRVVEWAAPSSRAAAAPPSTALGTPPFPPTPRGPLWSLPPPPPPPSSSSWVVLFERASAPSKARLSRPLSHLALRGSSGRHQGTARPRNTVGAPWSARSQRQPRMPQTPSK